MTISALVALNFVSLTTFNAVSDDYFTKMTIFSFKFLQIIEFHMAISQLDSSY